MIQFGTDQLQFAQSQELSSFVYWTLYMRYFLVAFILLIASIILATVYKNTIYFTILCFWCFKHHLFIEPAKHNNPVKLIWKVMKYSWTHKQPERHSAFTLKSFFPQDLT